MDKAEKMINFAISNGKTINKALLITVLHNKACAFEGIYDLSSLSKQLNTLVKNLNFCLKMPQNIENVEK